MHAGSPYMLVISALLFLLIAWDIFGSGLDAPFRSLYLLPHYADWPVHAWVKASTRHLFATECRAGSADAFVAPDCLNIWKRADDCAES